MLCNKKDAGGYFSLEAAILVPFTFFLFVLVIHLSFYFYGRCVAVQDAYLITLRAGLLRDGADKIGFMNTNSMWQLGEKYFGNQAPAVRPEIIKDEVKIEIESETNRSAFDLAGTDRWNCGGSATAMDINIPLRIRKADRIADIAQGGIGNLTGGQNGD